MAGKWKKGICILDAKTAKPHATGEASEEICIELPSLDLHQIFFLGG